MWLVFAILSGAFYTAQGLFTRHILKEGKNDAWAFSFYFSVVGALVSLPFFLTSIKIPGNVFSSYWLLMILSGLLIVAQNLLIFKSANDLPASISGAMTKFRLVWVFILGVIILKEIFNWQKAVGTFFAVMAGIIILNKAKKLGSFEGISFVFLSTIFYAIIIVFYKYLFQAFNSQSLTFFVFFIPAVINLAIMPNAFERITIMAKSSGWSVFVACVFGAFANLTMNYALSIGEASRVLVIIESFLVVTLVGEHLILKEKRHLKIKLLAVLMAIVGAVLIRLG